MAVNPKRTKLTIIRCIVAVPDDHGNLRFLISAETDASALVKLCGSGGPTQCRAPYRLWPADETGIRGEFWAKPRSSFKDHWLLEASRMRGRIVNVEVAPRKYCFVASGADKLMGWSLDLLDAKEIAKV